MALAKLAVRRQATIGEAEYEVFSDDLDQFEVRDVVTALDRIGTRPRGEYELAFPDSATLIRAVRAAEESRKTRIRPEQLRPEVRAALAASANSNRDMVRVDVGHLITEGIKLKTLKAPEDHVEEPKPSPTCPHCKIAAIMIGDAVALRKMEAFYRDKAERAEAKELSISSCATVDSTI